MPRTVKTIKDDSGNDLEVYADTCKVCNREMVFPKAEADKIDEMFPFIREKVEAGTACVDCAIAKDKEDTEFLFTEEEKQKIKDFIMNNV